VFGFIHALRGVVEADLLLADCICVQTLTLVSVYSSHLQVPSFLPCFVNCLCCLTDILVVYFTLNLRWFTDKSFSCTWC